MPFLRLACKYFLILALALISLLALVIVAEGVRGNLPYWDARTWRLMIAVVWCSAGLGAGSVHAYRWLRT